MKKTAVIAGSLTGLLAGSLLLLKRARASFIDIPILGTGPADTVPASKPWRVSEGGLRFIAKHEGFRAVPYEDAAGYCTVGYGHLLHKSVCTSGDEPVTDQEALDLFHTDIRWVEDTLNSRIHVELSQPQVDALASLIYNAGPGVLGDTRIQRKLNAGNYAGALAEFAEWNKINKIPSAGLTTRRAEEAAMFKYGTA